MIILKVRKELDSEGKRKQKFKGFLLENLDMFAPMHENMMPIDPQISCHPQY